MCPSQITITTCDNDMFLSHTSNLTAATTKRTTAAATTTTALTTRVKLQIQNTPKSQIPKSRRKIWAHLKYLSSGSGSLKKQNCLVFLTTFKAA